MHKLHEQSENLSSQWFSFGLAIGVPQQFLEKLEGYPKNECLVEVLDYWLKNHYGQPSWREIFDAQEKIRLNDPTNMDSINAVYSFTQDIQEEK